MTDLEYTRNAGAWAWVVAHPGGDLNLILVLDFPKTQLRDLRGRAHTETVGRHILEKTHPTVARTTDRVRFVRIGARPCENADLKLRYSRPGRHCWDESPARHIGRPFTRFDEKTSANRRGSAGTGPINK